MDEKTKKLLAATGLFSHHNHSYLMYLRQNFNMNELLDIAIDVVRNQRINQGFKGLTDDEFKSMTSYPVPDDD